MQLLDDVEGVERGDLALEIRFAFCTHSLWKRNKKGCASTNSNID